MKDLVDGSLEQLQPDDDDKDRYEKSCQVFDTSMTIRMILIFRLCGQLEAYQSDDGRRRICQIVDPVCNDSDAAGKKSERHFHQTKEQVRDDPHYTGKFAVLLSHIRVVGFIWIFDKQFDQK